MSPSVALRLSDVVKTYPGVVALKGVGFEVAEGEVHALVGENGAGKSTLMAVAAGSALPDSGSVEIGGRPVTQPPPAPAPSPRLAVVFPHPPLPPGPPGVEKKVFSLPPPVRAAPPRARAAAAG